MGLWPMGSNADLPIHTENLPLLVKFSYVGKHLRKAQPARLVRRPQLP